MSKEWLTRTSRNIYKGRNSKHAPSVLAAVVNVDPSAGDSTPCVCSRPLDDSAWVTRAMHAGRTTRKSPPVVDISETKDRTRASRTVVVLRAVAGSIMDFVQMLEKWVNNTALRQC
jgi:hypothetical protein